MIWGHDPPRTHEKITGKRSLFVRFVYCNGHNSTSLFSGSPGKKEKMNISIQEETLGQRIRAQRIRLGMTQEELAERLYVKKSTISYYETDKKEMRASCLAEIARGLYTTPDYLLGFEDEKDPFEKEVQGLLQSITDEKVRSVLLAQIKAVSNM